MIKKRKISNANAKKICVKKTIAIAKIIPLNVHLFANVLTAIIINYIINKIAI
jgi:hypothetical protein